MKRIFISLTLLVCSVASALAQQTPKYVFYFIGDGMGVNQVNGTETYMAAVEGRIGTKSLTFADFPYTAFVTTYSSSNGVTDSAAGGTALATGEKTYNGCLGLLPDSITPVTSVAVWAQNAGAAVGVTTSVSVDHATPASFYAHQNDRGKYYEVGKDLIASKFDFFAGSGSIGIESLSRGARKAYFIDNSSEANKCICENVKHTHFEDKATIFNCDAIRGAMQIHESAVDIVFMDPPYENGLEKDLLSVLITQPYINEDTLFVIEADIKTDFSYLDELGYELIKEKKYKTNKHMFVKVT